MKSVPERFVKDCITLAYKKTSSGESLASVISSLIYDVYAMGTTVGAAAERKACAKLCDENTNPNADKYEPVSQYQSGCYITAEYLATAIRARSINEKESG